MDRAAAVLELQRVAALLDVRSLSRGRYAEHGSIPTATIEAWFGSWTEAVTAAGLVPLPQGGIPKDGAPAVHTGPTDADLLDDLLRLARELGRRPSGNQIAAKGRYSREAYQRRWGTIAAAFDAALAHEARQRAGGAL